MNMPDESRKSGASPAIVLLAWGGALLFVVALAACLYAYLVRFGRPAAGNGIGVPAGVNLTLFSAFAVHHSLFARPWMKAAVWRWVPVEAERSFYTWIASVLLILTCWLWRPVPGVLYEMPAWLAWAGIAAQIAGLVLTIGGSRAIDVLDLAGVRPVLLARNGERPRHVPLMTRGVYGIVRHPLYFGWALLVFGAPRMTMTRFVFATVSTAYLAIAIPWEERSLVQTFGDDYRKYQRTVRWRMLPGLY
ncbi:MAG TPA: isoprenylcysteine carboxylmethyltransferase family protein [Vicinamibacterales bacterium]